MWRDRAIVDHVVKVTRLGCFDRAALAEDLESHVCRIFIGWRIDDDIANIERYVIRKIP